MNSDYKIEIEAVDSHECQENASDIHRLTYVSSGTTGVVKIIGSSADRMVVSEIAGKR